MSNLYLNGILTDIESLSESNEIINYFRRIRTDELDDIEYQEVIETVADECMATPELVLACLEMEDGSDYEAFFADEMARIKEARLCTC